MVSGENGCVLIAEIDGHALKVTSSQLARRTSDKVADGSSGAQICQSMLENFRYLRT